MKTVRLTDKARRLVMIVVFAIATVMSVEREGSAHMTVSRSAVRIPSHLTIKDQHIDFSVTGLRNYLESIRASDEALYGRLSPELMRLESKKTTALAIGATGAAISLASIGYGVGSRRDCALPAVTDPSFGAATAAWDRCHAENRRRFTTFALVGFAAATATMIGVLFVAPTRQDLLNVVNHHNRVNPEPLRLEMGYDPRHRFAFASAVIRY